MAHLEKSEPDEYKKRQEAIKRKIVDASKKSDSTILQNKAKEEERDKPEVQEKCEMTRMLVDEGIEMYRKGKMSYEDMINDLHKSLVAISKVKSLEKAI